MTTLHFIFPIWYDWCMSVICHSDPKIEVKCWMPMHKYKKVSMKKNHGKPISWKLYISMHKDENVASRYLAWFFFAPEVFLCSWAVHDLVHGILTDLWATFSFSVIKFQFHGWKFDFHVWTFSFKHENDIWNFYATTFSRMKRFVRLHIAHLPVHGTI